MTNGTGQGIDELQGNAQQVQGDGKMYTLRLVNDFAQSFKIPDTVIHLGGTYQRGSAANSGVNNQTPYSAASVQTEARGLTFFIPQPFNPTNAAAVDSNINRTDLRHRGRVRVSGTSRSRATTCRSTTPGRKSSTGSQVRSAP